MTERKEKAVWSPCLFLITALCLFLQGSPSSPIPLRQRGAPQIHFLKGTTTRKKQNHRRTYQWRKEKTRNECNIYFILALFFGLQVEPVT